MFLEDCSTQDLVDFLCLGFPAKKVSIGAHITTLNALYDHQISSQDFSVVDYVYCDGWSIYILGKLFGLKKIQRIATTDLFPLVIEKLNRPLKICFVGGHPDIGPLIIEKWMKKNPLDQCQYYDGYQNDWNSTLAKIRNSEPDLMFLGLGMPLELQFICNNYADLPNSIILTCGGMLRILAGIESRSPKIIQSLRLEWMFRLLTSPRRTFARYSKGLINFFRAALLSTVVRRRTKI